MATYDDPRFEAKYFAQQIAQFNVEPPEDAARWLARLTELEASRPEAPAPNALAELIADGADPADIDTAVAAYVGIKHRVAQHGEAERICGQRAMAAVRANRDTLHKQLAAIAEQLIDRLHAAAEITEPIAQLARERRTEDAALVAHADSDAEQLLALYRLRNQFATPTGAQWSTGLWSCENFSNPWDLPRDTSGDGSLWGVWRAGIRAGGQLWFPSVEEARAASEPHEPVDEPEPIDPANLVRWH
jgi:hypothetical protein